MLPSWPTAHGGPLFDVELRRYPQDFRVTESLGWSPSGDGEHDFLWVEKASTNTEWLARQLAQFASVKPLDVGYAGLKDRHAVTRQWFSVPRWHAPDWQQLNVKGVRVLAISRHQRKLRRGAHRSNRFEITVREPNVRDEAALVARVTALRNRGVPNYFGEQRFGRSGANLTLADRWARGERLRSSERSLAISTVRSFVFNEALAKRVVDGSWARLRSGEKANLEGSASVFDVDTIDASLIARCEELDIHPSMTLAGEGMAISPTHWQEALDRGRVASGNRSTRIRLEGLSVRVVDHAVVLTFELPRGAYATSVLRELFSWGQHAGSAQETRSSQ